MKTKLATLLKVAVFFGLGVLLVWLSVRKMSDVEMQEMFNSFKSANYFWVLLSCILGTFAHVSRAMRWNQLLKPMGYTPKLINTFCAVVIGYLVNFAIPRGGEISRCGVLNRYEKIPLQRVIGTVVTERIIDVILLLIVFFITFLVEFSKLNEFVATNLGAAFNQKLAGMMANKMLLVILAVVALAGLFTIWQLRGYFQKLKFYHKFMAFLKGLLEGIQTVRHLENPWLFIAHSIFIWLMYFGMVYVSLFAIPATAGAGAGAALSVLAVGSVAMMLTPGGFGAYPVFVASILVIYGISDTYGKAFGWIAWSGQFVSILAVGLLSLIILPYVNSATTNDEPEGVASV